MENFYFPAFTRDLNFTNVSHLSWAFKLRCQNFIPKELTVFLLISNYEKRTEKLTCSNNIALKKDSNYLQLQPYVNFSRKREMKV